jgi:predicted metal-dependent HD superfamily phosphohydrolase
MSTKEVPKNLEQEQTEKEKAIQRLIRKGLDVVKQRYGTGMNDGETPLFYHNFFHTLDVVKAVEIIGEMAVRNNKISPEQKPLIKIAAAWHDAEQSLGRNKSEDESAKMVKRAMETEGVFTPEEIEETVRLVLATRIYFDEKGIMKQRTTEDYATLIIADADLSSLGMKTCAYWERAINLLRETKTSRKLTFEEIKKFASRQVDFISNHLFLTPEAQILFPNQEENLRYVKLVAEMQL